MAYIPEIDDLRLVLAIQTSGSIGGAARQLLLSQPAASARLSRMERRIGTELFSRSPRGAVATLSGRVLTESAGHILAHLDRLAEEARAANESIPLRIACFHGLADSVLPLIDHALSPRTVVQTVDHGVNLIDWVAEGTQDAAVISIAQQATMPHGVKATLIGKDHMVALVPADVPSVGTGRNALRGLALPTSTYDWRKDELAARIAQAGGTPRFGATVTGTIRMARLGGQPAIVPRSSAVTDLAPGERIQTLPFTWNLNLSLITRSDPDPAIERIPGILKQKLGL